MKPHASMRNGGSCWSKPTWTNSHPASAHVHPSKSTLGVVVDDGTGDEVPVGPAAHASGWTFNWRGLAAVLLIAAITVVGWRWLGGPSVSSDDGAPSDEIGAGASSSPATTAPTSARGTTPPAPPPAPTTVPAPTTTTTTVALDRQVVIRGEMKPCRFGANCLVAGFTITGFEDHPGRFVCIYPNSRRDFSFNNDGVDEACITADQGDTITIEVDGIRSATISEENLDGR